MKLLKAYQIEHRKREQARRHIASVWDLYQAARAQALYENHQYATEDNATAIEVALS